MLVLDQAVMPRDREITRLALAAGYSTPESFQKRIDQRDGRSMFRVEIGNYCREAAMGMIESMERWAESQGRDYEEMENHICQFEPEDTSDSFIFSVSREKSSYHWGDEEVIGPVGGEEAYYGLVLELSRVRSGYPDLFHGIVTPLSFAACMEFFCWNSMEIYSDMFGEDPPEGFPSDATVEDVVLGEVAAPLRPFLPLYRWREEKIPFPCPPAALQLINRINDLGKRLHSMISVIEYGMHVGDIIVKGAGDEVSINGTLQKRMIDDWAERLMGGVGADLSKLMVALVSGDRFATVLRILEKIDDHVQALRSLIFYPQEGAHDCS